MICRGRAPAILSRAEDYLEKLHEEFSSENIKETSRFVIVCLEFLMFQ